MSAPYSMSKKQVPTLIPKHYQTPRYGEIDMDDIDFIGADNMKQAILTRKALERHAEVTKELIETKLKLIDAEKENKYYRKLYGEYTKLKELVANVG